MRSRVSSGNKQSREASWCFCRPTLQKQHYLSKNSNPGPQSTRCVGVVINFIAITGVLKECLGATNGPENDLDLTLCTCVLGLAWKNALFRSWFLVAACMVDADFILLDNTRLPFTVNINVARSSGYCRVVSFTAPLTVFTHTFSYGLV